MQELTRRTRTTRREEQEVVVDGRNRSKRMVEVWKRRRMSRWGSWNLAEDRGGSNWKKIETKGRGRRESA